MISVCQGEKIPRKGGPGITRSDLLIINKKDLAPYVGADLDVMDADTKAQRGAKPYVFTDMLRGKASTTLLPSSKPQVDYARRLEAAGRIDHDFSQNLV